MSASPRRRLINALLSATALAGAASLLPSGAAHAQTQWTGNTSTDWFTAGNWNPATVPGAATDVEINNGAVPNPANVTAAGATARSVIVGDAAGQSGTLNVTGGTLTVPGPVGAFPQGYLAVGNLGSGTMTVSAGGVVNANQSYIAANSDTSTGTVTITGSTSQWITTRFEVGSSGNGTLNVRNGATVTNTGVFVIGNDGTGIGAVGVVNVESGADVTMTSTTLGSPANSTGTLTVTGAGSSWTGSGSLTVGSSGTGTFNLLAGASATSGSVAIGSFAASGNGTANISGTGTSWTTGIVNVGTAGTGAMTVSGGAQVTSNRNSATGNIVTIGGTATVTGTGSQWLIDSGQPVAPVAGTALAIGKAASTSSLTVSNGGNVTVRNTATGTNAANFDVRIGVGAGTTANVTITGANSSFTTPYRFYVGFAANSTGNVTASNGGALNTGYTEIGAGPSAGVKGTVSVTGAGSTWTITDTTNLPGGHAQGVSLGLSGGDGTLTIGNGGTVNVNSTNRRVNLGGTAASRATLNIGAAAADPAAGAGTLNADTVTFLTNGGTSAINFNHTSSNYTFASSIGGTGPGAVNFLAGTTILTGNNTYAGTTSISAGATAQLGNGGNAGGSNGLVSGSISNNGNLIFNVGGFRTYSGVISGNGTVEQRGPANTTLTFTGNNTYAGLTTISSGTLQIGNGGTTGAIAGDVLNNSQIAFNRSDNISYNGVISGSGSLSKQGAGILTLGNVNTYTGGTSVGPGILRLGGNDRIASTGSLFLFSTGTFDLAGFNQTVGDLSGPGTVAIGTGTFTAGTASNRTFAGRFTGSGAFIKQGSGSLNLTGNNSAYTGTTTVAGGTLFVNGDLSASPVTVNAAGTLGGTGTVGVTNAFGAVAPGNSIGTLNIVGSFTQSSGSTYLVEVAAGGGPGTSDLISVTGVPGTATIQAGTTVSVIAAPGAYTTTTRYTILTATGGRTGTYTTLIDNAPFLDFALAYDPNNVYLDITRASAMFSSVAQTPNQRAAATGAENLGPGNPVFNAITPLDLANALRAFDLLSGEIHASIAGTLLEDSRFIRNAVTGRLQSIGGPAAIFAPRLAALNFADDGEETDTAALMFDSAALGYAPQKRKRVRDIMDRALPVKAQPAAPGRLFAAWGQAFGSWGSADGDGNAAALSRTTGGFITGLDVTLPGARGGDVWRAGLAGGYQYSSVNVGDRTSSGRIDTYHLAAYGGRQIGPLGLRAGASYGWHDISTSRSIVFPGFSDTTKAKYDAGTAQVFGEIGYALTHRQFALEPFAGLAYVSLRTTGFAEAGGAAALNGSGGTTDTTYSTLGLRAAAPLPWRDLAGLTAKASAAWRHAFGTVTPVAQLGFASGTTPFVVAGTPIARDAAALELGLEGAVARGGTLGVAYTGQIASRADDHGITANYVQRF
ncbi:MAG: autotransporter domain-containing protein [Xanthobacteraceae bacterium]|nr:autotransporter domain-containing protein [Xanthobacteraceae bacterium]